MLSYKIQFAGAVAIGFGLGTVVLQTISYCYHRPKPVEYHIVVDTSFNAHQYDVVVQAAAAWVSAVHDPNRLTITVEYGQCPADDTATDALCLIAAADRINCPIVNPVAVGCTQGRTSWIDTEFDTATTTNIILHEMGHLFGIPDMAIRKGVMWWLIDPNDPTGISQDDAIQFLKYNNRVKQ